MTLFGTNFVGGIEKNGQNFIFYYTPLDKVLNSDDLKRRTNDCAAQGCAGRLTECFKTRLFDLKLDKCPS